MQLPTGDRFDYGLPGYLEAGVVNLLNALKVPNISEDGTALESTSGKLQVGPTRDTPLAIKGKRITKAGRNVFAFTDHTAFTVSGAEAAAYTLSTVSGYNGIAAGDSVEGVAQGSKTGSTAMVKLVCNGTQAGAANYFITSASSLALTTGDEKFGMWVYFRKIGITS